MQVSSRGGNPKTLIEGTSYVDPQILPDGKTIIFTNASSTPYKIMVKSLDSGKQTELLQGVTARYLPTGHLSPFPLV